MNNWERVNLLFSAGSRPIKPAGELSLAELLLANRLPPSLFQAYEAPGNGSLRAIPITTPLNTVPNAHKVILQCIRNTDVDSLRANDFETLQRDPLPIAALFDFHYGKANATNRVHLVDDDSLRNVVSSKISSFLTENEITLPLVAGISGGGDSNTLVQGIRRYLQSASMPTTQVVCFTLVMDPLWPKSAAGRARELCTEAGFQHRVLDPAGATALLGMQGSPTALWGEFAERYGSDTSHFFGTFFVNLVGRRLCEEVSGRHLLLGYNREDILAELLFCLMNGRRPMPFPIRQMNTVKCVLPVWDVPKNLLDACYPHYSESNYTERVDTTTVARSSIYFIAHCLDALVPQLSISLMRGIHRLMTDLSGWQELLPIHGTPLSDGLVAKLGGPDLPACGGSIGVERILAVQTADEPHQRGLDVAVTVLGAEDDIMRLAGEIRAQGLRTGVYLGSSGKLAKQLKWAHDQRSRLVLIYGPDEQKVREVTVRNMESGEQTRVPVAEVGACLPRLC